MTPDPLKSQKTHSYLILGSGAKLYKSVEPFANGRVAQTWRTQDWFSGKFNVNAAPEPITIVFSMLEPPDLERLFRHTTGPILVVGSCAALSPVWRRFGYSRRKRHQLDAVLRSAEPRIKYVVFGNFFPKECRGLSYATPCSEFWKICDYAVQAPAQVVMGYSIVGSEDAISRLLTRLDIWFAPLSTVLLKGFTRFSYGYNNAAATDVNGLHAVSYHSR